jgi:hypothetical protein
VLTGRRRVGPQQAPDAAERDCRARRRSSHVDRVDNPLRPGRFGEPADGRRGAPPTVVEIVQGRSDSGRTSDSCFPPWPLGRLWIATNDGSGRRRVVRSQARARLTGHDSTTTASPSASGTPRPGLRSTAACRPLRKPRGQSARCSLPHESASALRLLAGTNQMIGKRLRAAPSAPHAVPEFMPKQNSSRSAMTAGALTTRRVSRLATSRADAWRARSLALPPSRDSSREGLVGDFCRNGTRSACR